MFFRKEFKELQSDLGKDVTQWRVVYFGRVVAEGVGTNPEKAEAMASAALNAYVDRTSERSADRKEHRKRIRRHLLTRPHLTLGMTRLLMAGVLDKGRIMAEAEQFELAEWEADANQHKMPLPRHQPERRGAPKLTPMKVAEQLWDSMVVLDRIKIQEGKPRLMPSARKWAIEMFGEEQFKS